MVSIRIFNIDRDLKAVLTLWQNAGSGIQLSPSDQPQEIKKKIARDPDLFLVAEDGGKIIGAVMGGFDGRRGIVYHLAVQKAYRRKGIGRILMEALEARLRAKGCLKSYLLVTKDNLEAQSFYQNLNWQEMNLIVMGKELT